MSENTDALRLSRRVLRVLIVGNVLFVCAIGVMLAASLITEDWVTRALLRGAPVESRSALLNAMRTIMVIGILAGPVTHIVLTRLLAIVETVRAGDPFIVLNAARLQTIAWAVLVLELMHLVIVGVGKAASTEGYPIDIDWNISATRWLAVLLLFVLSRVFEQGACMRDDLEGTV